MGSGGERSDGILYASMPANHLFMTWELGPLKGDGSWNDSTNRYGKLGVTTGGGSRRTRQGFLSVYQKKNVVFPSISQNYQLDFLHSHMCLFQCGHPPAGQQLCVWAHPLSTRITETHTLCTWPVVSSLLEFPKPIHRSHPHHQLLILQEKMF